MTLARIRTMTIDSHDDDVAISRFLAIRSSHIAKAGELQTRSFMEPVVRTSSCVGVV